MDPLEAAYLEGVKLAMYEAGLLKDAVQKGQKLQPGSLKGGPSQPSSSAKPGQGGRFQALKKKLSKKPGVTNPGALAAAIGRAKFGKGKFQGMAAKGR